MLPHFIAQDMRDVVRDLCEAGYEFAMDWFGPFLEFRFPRYGSIECDGMQFELRQALEPWHVLGEQASAGGMARYVDSSVERLQVRATQMTGDRYVITCNGRPLPMTPTGVRGEYVSGVRYKAWAPPSALHPSINVHSPLKFDVVDAWNERSIAGCTYHVSHPGGRNYASVPVNANEAQARRAARFITHGHTPGKMILVPENPTHAFPLTLDLRREPDTAVAFGARTQSQQQQQ